MGDINNKGLERFELNTTSRLKLKLLENLRQNKSKQIIQLNGKSSLIFANLAAITLASCGGGGGGGSSPAAPSFSFSNQSFTFSEDTPGSFSITTPSGTTSITVDSIPSGLTLTTSDGVLLAAGTELTSSQLSDISFSSAENANSELNSFGNLVLTATDGTNSSTANISFTVNAIDDVPSLVANSFTFTEDTAASFDISVVEVDGDTLTITVEALPSSGTLSLADGTAIAVGDVISTSNLEGIVYTPETNANSDITSIGDFVLNVADGTTSNANSISIIVNAVNDTPTLGSLDAVDVLETIAADATILKLSGADVDGDTLTYSLSGDDAELFNVDSSGNVSFKASPNFKAPGDVGSDNTYNFTLTVTDAAGATASSALVVNIIDVKPSGQAIDGYLVGATVWVDLDGDGVKDENEPETTTDKTGAFEFEDDIPSGTDIYVEGGYDLGTGKPNEQKFKLTTAVTGDGSEALVISPVSTQISRAYSKSGVTLSEAQEKVGKAYGLDEAFENLTNFDPIALAYSATSNDQAKAALTAQARNIMVSSLGEVSKKVSEYFASEIAPTTRSQISDIFKFGSEVLRYSTWDSNVDLREQPRIVIELEGFEDLLASTSETFNDKIVEAILASEDLEKLFEMKSDGTGQFDTVISNATDAIILEIRNLILSEMGFDPATNFTTFKSLENYEGETVTFLGSTKTMGEWAVLMTDVLDSMDPDPYTGLVDFGPDGGVTDFVGKYFAEQMAKMARLMETMAGKPFAELTDAQIDQLVDMGFEYRRQNTFDDSYSRWVPYDEYGQELWSQNIWLNYSQERFRHDSQGNRIEGNTGQWQLTAEQVKAYLKDPSIQLNDGNWGNEFTTYNWTTAKGDLGMYLALAEARDTTEIKDLMDALTPGDGQVEKFVSILDASFTQGKKVFQNLVSSALDFTLDKFTKFVEKTIDYDNDEAYISSNPILIPVTKSETVTLSSGETLTLNTITGRDWDINSWGNMSIRIDEEGDYSYSLTGTNSDILTISDLGIISFKDAAPDVSALTDDNNEFPVTVVITDNSDGFSQEVEFNIVIPTWESLAQNMAAMETAPSLVTRVFEVNEHQLLRQWDQYTPGDYETGNATVVVTVAGSPPGQYYMDGELTPGLEFKVGTTYRFDLSDPSNSTHPLRFSETVDGRFNGGSEYTDGVTYVGTAGSAGAYVEITISEDTPDNLYYYCDVHAGMGNNASNFKTFPPRLEGTSETLYKGIPLELDLGIYTGQDVHVRAVESDRFGQSYQDNSLFYIHQEGEGADKEYYLRLRDGDSLDYENPIDTNGDNIYNLTIEISVRDYIGGKQPIASIIDAVVVVNDVTDDPVPSFPSWWQEDTDSNYSFSDDKAPVASISEVNVNGKTLTSSFVVGSYSRIDHSNVDLGENPTVDDLLAVKFPGPITSSITGGPDADLFIVVDRENGSAFFFKERPSHDNPSDANGDNVYEFELTKTDGTNSVTKTVKIRINETTEDASDPVVPPSSPLVINIDEVPEDIGGDRGGNRNIIGTDEADTFTRDNNGFKYISGGLGDDTFKELREGYLTGGDGADRFFISADARADKDNFGIRDNSQPYVEGDKEGINGYDQNRDGILDLATELDWSWVPLISDFTPGVDKIHLTTYGWTGQNVPTIQKSKITIEQGTGDLIDHTLIVLNDSNATQQGHDNGSVIAVLLNTNATTISKETDLIEDGSDNQLILGNLRDAVGGTEAILQDTDGNDVSVIQLSNGEYIWVWAQSADLDNEMFFRAFATAPNGDIYAPRQDNLDFENPTDANKDNTYELLMIGQTFKTLVLEQQPWGGYWPDWNQSESTGNIAFNLYVSVNDVASDNVGKISIAEADFFGGTDDGNSENTALNTEMVDLVFKQISAVQGSLMDIDFKAIAEEISFDFNFFATADLETQAQEWFEDYQSNRFRDFGRELEETFERNLLSKFSTYTNADSLTNVTGTADDDTIEGTDLKETIFGKKGNDTITGGDGDDVIFGDQGDDTLDGGPGSDAMDGGSGDDTFIVGEGLDVMDGASGKDKFDFTNVTSLPEYIKGGSGVDTIILSGLSSNGLEVDDGNDADALPDYTGIDLNKIVSVKETWTYTDENGTEQTEEGWRNRLESIESIDLRDSESQINKSAGTETVFSDVLNITWDALQRMSWDNRTWTIRGDETDTVRLLGHEWTYNEGSTLKTQFEPFRFEGTTVQDGITYNKYELWDGIVLIEDGITVIYGRRELGKAVAGENESPEFWYQWKTVYENSVAVFGKVENEWDRDGDNITYSLAETGDYQLFNIDSATGEVTFKVAPNYEAPQSTSALSIGSTEADFASVDANALRSYNQYRVDVIGDDGSGEANAKTTNTLHIEVRNLPDYDGYDETNKIPFFKDMWGSASRLIEDDPNQSIQIKGFDLDFDTLTWSLVGVRTWREGESSTLYGTMEDGSTDGIDISTAPFTLSSTGLLKPTSTLSYETDITTFQVYVTITDGKSSAVGKEYYFEVEDTIDDGTLVVRGKLMNGAHTITQATVWQDLDNDGVQDGSEPTATSDFYGNFNLSLKKSSTDAPIIAKGGVNTDTGLANSSVLKINSNLKEVLDRDWGEYSLSPTSSISIAMQNLDRSIVDRDSTLDILKAFGMDPLWHEGDGNFYGSRFWNIKNNIKATSTISDWDAFNLNIFTLNNLLSTLGDSFAIAANQIITDALADVNSSVSSTANVSGYSAASLTNTQIASVKAAAYDAMFDAIAEMISGKSSFDGFRLSENNPIKITDHEGSKNVIHTPQHSVDAGVLTLDTSNSEINQAELQSALNLEAGAKGLLIEVELGTLPQTAQTIEFKGVLIDGDNSTVDVGERGIDIRFQVIIDPSNEVGAFNYAYVPDSSDITVIYTGEDGTPVTTTVEQSGNMITVATNAQGVPVMSVDFNEVFARGIPQTDLSTYFTTTTASNGQYYLELDFAGSSLQTSSGDAFTKVVAPFKVASNPTPVAYVNDITVSESRGWNQLKISLSKPATETFTIDYVFTGGDATRNDDYWWWSDQSGYRQITFVEGQSVAVVNLDVRDDSTVESDETFNIELSVASGSEGKVILGNSNVVVTIEDDDGSSGINLDSLVEKVLNAIKPTLAAELKTLTDANSATLSSVSTTFSDILLSNSGISDVSAYLTTEISEDSTLYDPILKAVVSLADDYVKYARGTTDIEASVKVDGVQMAKDLVAVNIGFNGLDLSSFTSTASDSLRTAIIDDIYTTSGFKYNSATTIVNGEFVYDRVVDSDAIAYENQLFPVEMRPFHIQNDSTFSQGTSAADSINFNTENGHAVYQGLAGDDVIELSQSAGHIIYGGSGDDIIKETTSDGYNDYYSGGPGNDKLAVYYSQGKKITGGSGQDVFILDYVTNGAKLFDASIIDANDENYDGTIGWEEVTQNPLIITDFEQGVDKIGLRNGSGDWNGKTIIAVQGTGTLSNHTLLFMGKSERGLDSEGYVWSILWNTSATDITSDDFVLVDSSYATSTLSGVTISSDASLASDSLLSLIDDASKEDTDNSENSFLITGLVDDNNGLSFEHIGNPDPVLSTDNYDEIFSDNFSSPNEDLTTIVIEELEDEEILISIDIV